MTVSMTWELVLINWTRNIARIGHGAVDRGLDPAEEQEALRVVDVQREAAVQLAADGRPRRVLDRTAFEVST